MARFLTLVTVGSIAIAQFSFAEAKAKSGQEPQSASALQRSSGTLHALPQIPKGKSTVVGGAIRNVNPVRDQFTLKVFGGKQMEIFYDERTRFFQDGKKTPLRDLRPEAHASVETILDGTDIFALSIHILSQAPQGECQGQVVSYNPGTGELTVNPVLSHVPIELRVPAGIPIVRTGQAGFASTNSSPSDLVKGTLVLVNFESGNNGRGVATHVAILAVPGSAFVFTGNITFLDLHAHTMVVVDPLDGNTYKIDIDPSRFPESHDLHQDARVRVTTTFDGTSYVATAITVLEDRTSALPTETR